METASAPTRPGPGMGVCAEELVVSVEEGPDPRILVRETGRFGAVQMEFSPATARALAAYLLHAAASVDTEYELQTAV